MLYKFKYIAIFFSAVIFFSCGKATKNQNQSSKVVSAADSVLTLNDLSNLIRKNPHDAKLFIERAKLFILNNNINDAISDLNIATHLDSLNPSYYIKLADLYLKIGKSAQTKETLERCIKHNPESDAAMHRMASLYFYVKDYKKSMEWLNKTQEVNPNMPQLYFTKAMLYKETGDTQMAIRNFHIAVEKEPDYYDAYILLGLIHSELKDTIAIAYYQNAINILPKSLEAYYNMAVFFQENNYTNRAIDTYNLILNEIDSLQPYIHFNLGYIYMEKMKDYNKAITKFTEAIKINEFYVAAYYNMGYCYESLRNYELANKNYHQALELDENYELAILGLNRIDKNRK